MYTGKLVKSCTSVGALYVSIKAKTEYESASKHVKKMIRPLETYYRTVTTKQIL
jgi:deoxyinosine 3'endonuclease (endonuclease V)